MKSKFLAGLVLLLAAAARASACAACFGKTDSPMAKGLNAGIFVLLGVVAAFWVLFGSFFVFIALRAKRVNPEPPGGEKQDA